MWYNKILIWVYVFLNVYVYYVDAIRICKTFRDYDIPHSKNCWDDPSDKLNTSEIVRRWGFNAEEHYITTDDGYKLLLVRAFTNITQKSAIVIGPGLHMNSLAFVSTGTKSITYNLGKIGFDVWILNFRGTRYSREHVNLTTDDNDYWHFSLHEIGVYDVRAALKTIYTRSNKKSIYISLSAGTSVGYIYATKFPAEAKERLTGMIMISPMAYFKPDSRSIWNIGLPIFPIIRQLTYSLFHGENLKHPLIDLLKIFSSSSNLMIIGHTIVSMLGGQNFEQMDPETLPLFFQLVPDSFGIDAVGHFFQWQASERFQHYDYGFKKNMEVYGQIRPPLYELRKILVPIRHFVAQNDWISSMKINKRTYAELEGNAKCGVYVVPDKKWTHLDFTQGKNVVEMIIKPIIRTIETMETDRCNQQSAIGSLY